MKTIFVQIASYRDPECQWTVKDLLAKAKQPKRIHVGICWQYDPERDENCFKEELPEQVRLNPFHWEESQGICWARHQAQQLYDGEDYVLSIDSRTRFTQDWDELLISQLDKCSSPKPVLSNYPASYAPPDNLQSDAQPTILVSRLYSPQGDLRVRSIMLDSAPKKPLQGAFVAGRFIFTKGSFIREVPYDPYLYFAQEDISLSARLFTHGYDVYSPNSIVLYQQHPDDADKREKDHKGWLKLQERARRRLNHLLGFAQSEHPEIVKDIDKYGLGTARTLEEYEKFCGIDFRKRGVSEKALRGGFIENLSRYLEKPLHVPEIDTMAATPAPAQQAASEQKAQQPALFNQDAAIERVVKANPEKKNLNIDRQAPEGVLVIYDYVGPEICKMLKDYADSQTFTELEVVDPNRSTKDKIVSYKDEGRITHHVDIDGRAHEILDIFNDIYCRQMASFYDVNFEWYERPQILRYPPGGKYNQHADSDHWIPEKDEWVRAQDRDYSVLLYLNDEYEGGELELINQKFKIKPKPGMLLAFPSDHRYLHAARPTTSGIRYVIVSWAAILGSLRILNSMPFASIYVRQKRGL